MMLGIFAVAGTLISGAFSAIGLGGLGSIFTGIGQIIVAVIAAIGEIIAALAQSPEGRAVLCICAVSLLFLYGRWHYIEEGKADARPQIEAAQKACRHKADDTSIF